MGRATQPRVSLREAVNASGACCADSVGAFGDLRETGRIISAFGDVYQAGHPNNGSVNVTTPTRRVDLPADVIQFQPLMITAERVPIDALWYSGNETGAATVYRAIFDQDFNLITDCAADGGAASATTRRYVDCTPVTLRRGQYWDAILQTSAGAVTSDNFRPYVSGPEQYHSARHLDMMSADPRLDDVNYWSGTSICLRLATSGFAGFPASYDFSEPFVASDVIFGGGFRVGEI